MSARLYLKGRGVAGSMADLGYRFLLLLRLTMVVFAFERECWVASNSGLPREDESDCGEVDVSESSAVHNPLSQYSKLLSVLALRDDERCAQAAGQLTVRGIQKIRG